MKKTSEPIIYLLVCVSILIMVSLACNLPRDDGRNLTLDSPAEDGSISGSYQSPDDSGDHKVEFSVTADGFATFHLEGAPESETVTVNLSDEQTASLEWKGTTLDGLGALTEIEHSSLDDLMKGDLAYSIGMIPLDIACQGDDEIDPKQVAALLVPLQMRFKYLVSDRGAESQELIALSQCGYGDSDNSEAERATFILLSRAAPVPVVLGYFPFDAEGAVEPPMSSGKGSETACLAASPSITAEGLVASNWVASSPETILGLRVNEWGPCDAWCRGACGNDCEPNNCKYKEDERCEKDGQKRYTGLVIKYYVYECGLHQGCIDHDYCYDQCNADYGCNDWRAAACRHGSVSKDNPPATPPPPWWYCDQKAAAEYGHENTSKWVLGYGAMTTRETFEYFDESAEKKQDLKECPIGESDPPTSEDEGGSIPVGTYTGNSNFSSTLENDVDDSFSEPLCKENITTVVIESDGSAQGELRSICYANARAGETSRHSEVIGIISGKLTDSKGQLSVSYTWRSYIAGPQCTPETPCRDDTVTFDFLYHVSVSGGMMTFTPAGDVEDYYSFELTKQ